jgi:hypothetical protein
MYAKAVGNTALSLLLPPGGWLLATAHIVTAIIGAGVLGLPYAMSWLGECHARAVRHVKRQPDRCKACTGTRQAAGKQRTCCLLVLCLWFCCYELTIIATACLRASLTAGWVGGIGTLLVFCAITAWASLLLTECHETGGVRHPTYRSAVLHILGGSVGNQTRFWCMHGVLNTHDMYVAQ